MISFSSMGGKRKTTEDGVSADASITTVHCDICPKICKSLGGFIDHRQIHIKHPNYTDQSVNKRRRMGQDYSAFLGLGQDNPSNEASGDIQGKFWGLWGDAAGTTALYYPFYYSPKLVGFFSW